MPRTPKGIVNIASVEDKIWLRCRNCRSVWYPDASRWRGENPVKEKVLRCPKCNVKNTVPRVVVRFLVKQANGKKTEYGWGKPTE